MIIGVTGSRNWTSRLIIRRAFDEAWEEHPDHSSPVVLIEGGARGADLECKTEAIRRGWHPASMQALWGFYGNAAGHVRNDAMVYLGVTVAHRWLAFINPCFKKDCTVPRPHDSHGAAQCAAAARLAGIRVKEYRNGLPAAVRSLCGDVVAAAPAAVP